MQPGIFIKLVNLMLHFFILTTGRCHTLQMNDTVTEQEGITQPMSRCSDRHFCVLKHGGYTCYPCKCDSACVLLGDCCPSAESIFDKALYTTRCINPHRDIRHYGQSTGRYFMVTDCPQNHVNKTEVELCVSRDNIHGVDIITLSVPVTVRFLSRTFRNRFCAACNGIGQSDIIFWEGFVSDCEYDILEAKTESVLEFFTTIIQNFGCIVDIKPALELKDDSVINMCPKIDVNVRDICTIPNCCQRVNTVFLSEYNKQVVLCDFRNPPFANLLSFSALLDFSLVDDIRPIDTNLKNCNDGYIFDSALDICRPITCTTPMMFKNGVCLNPISAFSSKTYRIFVGLTPDHDVTMDILLMQRVQLADFLQSRLFDYNMKTCSITLFTRDLRSSCVGPLFYADILILIDGTHNANELVDQILLLHNNATIEIGEREYVFLTSLETPFLDDTTNSHCFSIANNYKSGLLVNDTKHTLIHYCTKDPVMASKLTFCPHIVLEEYEYTFDNRNIEICISALGSCLSSGNFELVQNFNAVQICLEDYLRLVEQCAKCVRKSVGDGWDVEHILTLVFLSLSSICLLLAIITYLLFKTLLTFPGKINLALLSTLLVAHLAHILGSEQKTDTVCRIAGVVIHFFWVASFFWMQVSCLHMYIIFRKIQIQYMNFSSSTFVFYTLYCFTSATIFVAVNVVVSLVTSNGADMGYSASACYISSASMIGFAFVFPLGFVLLTNFVLFALTVVKLYQDIKFRSGFKDEKSNLIIYIKLSSLTGLSWLFGFIAEWTQIKALAYLFIITCAGQGIFLMVSFMVNHRVKMLYKSLLTRGQRTKLNSKTSRHISIVTD